MNTNGNKFEQQDHPLKNTDRAFVQVGRDGEPVIPDVSKQTDGDKQNDSSKTTGNEGQR